MARGTAYADYDRDGDLDVIVTSNHGPAVLLKNEGGNANNYLSLRLQGKKSNRSALGTVVRIGKQWQTVTSGTGYCSQSDLALTFGLGKEATVAKVEIEWPSGARQTLTNVKTRQHLVIAEP